MNYWRFTKKYYNDTLEYLFVYANIKYRAVIFKNDRDIAHLILEFEDSDFSPLDILQDKDVKALMDLFEKNKVKYVAKLLEQANIEADQKGI